MKKNTRPALWVLSISIAALFACNDPTVIGSDLLSGDQLDIEFTDTFTLRASTVLNDSMVVWGPGANGVNLQNFAFGDFQDPVFGKTVASIFAQFVSFDNNPKFKPTHVLDSVVLMLAYNEDLSYGKLDEPFTLEVYRMSQGLDVDEQYTNADSFSVYPAPLASATFVPNLKDSLTVLEPDKDTIKTVKLPPQLRIRLDDAAIMDTIFGLDSLIFVKDSAFLEAFRGIWLKPASQNAGLLSFAMRSTSTNIRFYYTDGDKKKSYDFKAFTNNPIVLHQRNYYGGSEVAQNMGQADQPLLFMQGLNGVNIELEIPYAEELKDIIINKAELVLPIITLPNDNDLYTPISQIYATELVSVDSLILIDDIYLPIRNFNLNFSTDDFGDYFGGRATTGDEFYKLSLSAHLQKMATGETTKKLRFTAFFRSESAARVVLAGPTHPTSPAKLRITYTRY